MTWLYFEHMTRRVRLTDDGELEHEQLTEEGSWVPSADLNFLNNAIITGVDSTLDVGTHFRYRNQTVLKLQPAQDATSFRTWVEIPRYGFLYLFIKAYAMTIANTDMYDILSGDLPCVPSRPLIKGASKKAIIRATLTSHPGIQKLL